MTVDGITVSGGRKQPSVHALAEVPLVEDQVTITQ